MECNNNLAGMIIHQKTVLFCCLEAQRQHTQQNDTLQKEISLSFLLYEPSTPLAMTTRHFALFLHKGKKKVER